MRFKEWPVAAVGLASLLVLLVASLQTAWLRANRIQTEIERLNVYHYDVDAKLRLLRTDIYLSSIFARDSMLDAVGEHPLADRQRLAEFRQRISATVAELHVLAGQHADGLGRLDAQLDEYWRMFEPLFEGAPTDKVVNSTVFLQREALPRRDALFALASELEALNDANFSEQQSEAQRRYAGLHADLLRLLWQSALVGLGVTLVVVLRLRRLETRSEGHLVTAERAEQDMRQLSQRLVGAQEEERKDLARELHDNVAQVLTALRMEIGRIDRARAPDDTRIASATVECRALVDHLFLAVRNLSLGLRPSMLDDFGLRPALEWHARDFTSRFGVDVELRIEGDLDAVPDPFRTCVYRSIQEALTNCARHSQAQSVQITVIAHADRLEVSLTDDGVGIGLPGRPEGLGLRGMRERVRELSGTMTISGAPEEGTTLNLHLPLPEQIKDVPRESIAG